MAIERIGELTAEPRTNSEIDVVHFANGSTASISSAQKNTGGYAYDMISRSPFGPYITVPKSAYRLSYFFRYSGNLNGTNHGIYIAANGNSIYESPNIWIAANYTSETLEIRRPVVGTANSFEVLVSAPMPPAMKVTDAWTQYAITHKIHGSDGFLTLRVGGVVAIQLLGDTRLFGQGNGTNVYATTANHILGAGCVLTNAAYGSNNFIDDMYLDSIEGEPDTPPPPRRFDVRLPTGAGADDDWTPLSSTNVSNIDDNPNDGDTTYNKALSAGLKDTFEFSSITVPTDYRVIRQITKIFAKRLDTGIDSTIKAHTYNGSTYDESAELTLPGDYTVPVRAQFDLDPNGDAWNETTVNASQLGYESAGDFA